MHPGSWSSHSPPPCVFVVVFVVVVLIVLSWRLPYRLQLRSVAFALVSLAAYGSPGSADSMPGVSHSACTCLFIHGTHIIALAAPTTTMTSLQTRAHTHTETCKGHKYEPSIWPNERFWASPAVKQRELFTACQAD